MTPTIRQLINQSKALQKSMDDLDDRNYELQESSRLNREEKKKLDTQLTETSLLIWEALRYLQGNYFLCDDVLIVLEPHQSDVCKRVVIRKPTVVNL